MTGVVTNTKTALIDNNLVPVIQEMMRLFPDGIVVTSGIYALLTNSFPFAIFFTSMLEATVVFHLLRSVTAYLGVSPMYATRGTYAHICRTGFTDPATSLLSMSIFGQSSGTENHFPSPQIYILSAASAYLFSTLNSQSKELAALGPAYSSRYYFSLIFLVSLIFIFVVFRIAYGCESFATVIVSVPIGLFIGAILVQQNARLFGPESINLIGIPLLKAKTATGNAIMVCPGQSA